MRRRDFIALLGGAAVARPGSTIAQQPDQLRRIGVLMSNAESDPEGRSRAKALRLGLQGFGWNEDRNLRVDYRWAAGEADRFNVYAAELVKKTPDVILAVGTAAVAALRQETRTIPIVFTQVSDPIGQGFVTSLARPGGNITGFSNYDATIGGKWLGLLKEIEPGIARAAVIFNPETAPYAALYFRSLQSVAPSIAVELSAVSVHNETEIEDALTALARDPGGGLIVIPDAFTVANRVLIFGFALRYRLPAVYPFRYFAVDGGLISYGVDQIEQFLGAASYVNRILKGEKPGDLPVQAPTKFELVINLKTAKALGLTVPPSMLLRADEVIE